LIIDFLMRDSFQFQIVLSMYKIRNYRFGKNYVHIGYYWKIERK